MYEWKSEFGYNREELEAKKEEIINAGGVATLTNEYGLNMSGHEEFMGIRLAYIEPDELRAHVEEPMRIEGLS